jgi:hypothetical protein
MNWPNLHQTSSATLDAVRLLLHPAARAREAYLWARHSGRLASTLSLGRMNVPALTCFSVRSLIFDCRFVAGEADDLAEDELLSEASMSSRPFVRVSASCGFR